MITITHPYQKFTTDIVKKKKIYVYVQISTLANFHPKIVCTFVKYYEVDSLKYQMEVRESVNFLPLTKML